MKRWIWEERDGMAWKGRLPVQETAGEGMAQLFQLLLCEAFSVRIKIVRVQIMHCLVIFCYGCLELPLRMAPPYVMAPLTSTWREDDEEEDGGAGQERGADVQSQCTLEW